MEFRYCQHSWLGQRCVVEIRRPVREGPSAQLGLIQMRAYGHQLFVTNLAPTATH